jgi:sodium/bile acid cotransporter 7
MFKMLNVSHKAFKSQKPGKSMTNPFRTPPGTRVAGGHRLPLAMWLGALCGLILAACGSSGAQPESDRQRRQQVETMYEDYRKSFPDVADIAPREARDLMQTEKVVFIDERRPEEQAVSMLPNSITSEEFLRDPSKYDGYTKIAYCTISYRSGKLAREMNDRDIHLVNLRGGILAWVHDGGTVYDENGPTDRIHVYGPKWNLAPGAYKAVW